MEILHFQKICTMLEREHSQPRKIDQMSRKENRPFHMQRPFSLSSSNSICSTRWGGRKSTLGIWWLAMCITIFCNGIYTKVSTPSREFTPSSLLPPPFIHNAASFSIHASSHMYDPWKPRKCLCLLPEKNFSFCPFLLPCSITFCCRRCLGFHLLVLKSFPVKQTKRKMESHSSETFVIL